jgi:hypothetical protein
MNAIRGQDPALKAQAFQHSEVNRTGQIADIWNDVWL